MRTAVKKAGKRRPGSMGSGAVHGDLDEKVYQFLNLGALPLTRKSFEARMRDEEARMVWESAVPSWAEEEDEDVDEFLDFGGGDISEENFLQKTRDFHANATWRHVLRIDELAIETYKRVYKMERYMGSLTHVMARRIKKERAKVLKKRKMRQQGGYESSEDSDPRPNVRRHATGQSGASGGGHSEGGSEHLSRRDSASGVGSRKMSVHSASKRGSTLGGEVKQPSRGLSRRGSARHPSGDGKGSRGVSRGMSRRASTRGSDSDG